MSVSRCIGTAWKACKHSRSIESQSILCPRTTSNNPVRTITTSSPRYGPESSNEGSEEHTSTPATLAPNQTEAKQSSPPQNNRPFNLPSQRPQDDIRNELIQIARSRGIELPNELKLGLNAHGREPRLPRSVQALYLQPLHREPTHGIPVCNLQLRSYSVRNLEYVADFAARAAYYLNLPAKGPIPLPRITQRFTVPRSNFVHKKSQQNFERVTLRRLIQVQDGDAEVVQRWLAFVRKWTWYGVGMKADVFEFEDMDVVKRMDEMGEEAVASGIEGVRWELFGTRKSAAREENVGQLLEEHGLQVAPQLRQEAEEEHDVQISSETKEEAQPTT